MRTTLFAIYDTQARVYGAPFSFSQPGQAIRAFKELANDDKTMIGRHPSDFVLYEIGFFDDATGVVEAAAHKSYGPATQYVDQMKDMPLFPTVGQELVTAEGK